MAPRPLRARKLPWSILIKRKKNGVDPGDSEEEEKTRQQVRHSKLLCLRSVRG